MRRDKSRDMPVNRASWLLATKTAQQTKLSKICGAEPGEDDVILHLLLSGGSTGCTELLALACTSRGCCTLQDLFRDKWQCGMQELYLYSTTDRCRAWSMVVVMVVVVVKLGAKPSYYQANTPLYKWRADLRLLPTPPPVYALSSMLSCCPPRCIRVDVASSVLTVALRSRSSSL